MPDLAKAYVQIIPSADGISGGIEKALGGEAKSAGESAGSSFASYFKTAAFGTTVVAAAKAMWSAITDTADYGDMVNDMSQKMGMSAEAYQEWDAVMQHSGTTMETLKSGMKTLANAVENGNEAFERLGITEKDLASMNSEELFSAVITGLQNVEDTTERTYLAGQLLGRGATELGVLLNESAESTQAMKDRVHELGGVMSDEAIRASDEFNDNMQDLKTAFSGLGRDIIADALPALNSVLSVLTDIFAGIHAYRTEGFDATATGFASMAANIETWAGKVSEAEEDMYNPALAQGAETYWRHYNDALDRAQEQLDSYLNTEKGQAEVLDLLESGEISLADAAQMSGKSQMEIARIARQAADARRTAAKATDEETEALSEEELAAQQAAEQLSGLTLEAMYAARGGDDLRASYNELASEIGALSDVEDENLQQMAEQALATLNLAATNQELVQGYPAHMAALESMGGSVTQLSQYLIDNGITAQEWGSQVASATGNIINGFEELDTSLDMSLADMAANLEKNITASREWNTNIQTLMAAAIESGDQSAVAFVQYMQEMGIGAAAQVAEMVNDVDGTLATFAPLFGDAAEEGIVEVTTAIEAGKVDVSGVSEGIMSGASEAMEGFAGFTEIGEGKVEELAGGMTDAAGTAEGAAEGVILDAQAAADGVGGWDGIGGNIDSGIAAGIANGTFTVTEATRAMIRAAKEAAKEEALIASPSELFADEVGAWIPPGVAEGITGNLEPLTDASRDMIDQSLLSAQQVQMDGMWVSAGGSDVTALLETWLPQLANMQVVMQDGTVVGVLMPGIDAGLYQHTNYAGRGLAV